MGQNAIIDSKPTFSHIIPITIILSGTIVAIPSLLLDILLNPSTYIFSSTPLVTRLTTLRRRFFYHAWRSLSPKIDAGDAEMKRPLLSKAYGVVLEIGAGVGDNIKYYTRERVQRLIVVEPNVYMHPQLREKANAAGYFDADGSLLLLGCGGAASDERALVLAGVRQGGVDTVVSVHVLCGIPGAAQAVEMYRRLLRQGGLFIVFEHVKSAEKSIAGWQSWYTNKIWRAALDGCELDRPTQEWILNGPTAEVGEVKKSEKASSSAVEDMNGVEKLVKRRWKEYEMEGPEGQGYSFVPHIWGFAIKA